MLDFFMSTWPSLFTKQLKSSSGNKWVIGFITQTRLWIGNKYDMNFKNL